MPEIGGETAPGFEAVREAFAAVLAGDRQGGAAVSAYLHGRKVVDLWGGIADPEHDRPWRRDTLQVVYSTTKGVTAACAHLLAQRGELDLDAPVADYWPEFAANGKDRIPVRWLLTHQAGLPVLDRPITPAQAVAWEPVVTALAAQRPVWEPGTDHGYHAHTYGWLVGEVVRRVSGRSIGAFLAEEIAEPLGLDLWIGLPEAERHRVSRIIATPPDMDALAATDLDALPEAARDVMAAYADPTSLTVRAMMLVQPPLDHNDPAEQSAEMPSTNGICTARALARFYAALIGEVDGHRILTPATLAAATREQVSGIDRILRVPVRIGTGFGLPTPDAFWYGPAAFGFPGYGGSLGFADPATGLAFGYVLNHIRDGAPDQGAAVLLDAVRSAMKGLGG
ncbi:CubicO group peptidase (beta-lactamase class C family) [Thermocatellispora tengchongensis]|uniref:CubicO group peptidase (Beta-lactamase class C family) n=1 Tax=Thermocatellispora tengchongensis TaxID=1073253 RepID=A0A840PFP2_9ACTN|nr:serine hydrolase domain-containing protein [Thermocatellispora tengchongensis]MBB5136661.1 CubicO group peptidase (beta-lactamase class C family) [Thermocatellispora tengchongensis]